MTLETWQPQSQSHSRAGEKRALPCQAGATSVGHPAPARGAWQDPGPAAVRLGLSRCVYVCVHGSPKMTFVPFPSFSGTRLSSVCVLGVDVTKM